MGSVMHEASSGAPVADGALVDTAQALTADAILERRVAVGHGPIGDIAAGGAGVVVTNPTAESVSVLDAAGRMSGMSLVLAGEPVSVVVTDDRAYVTTASVTQDTLSVVDLDAGTVAATFPLAFGVSALAASPDGKRVYAGRTANGHVDITVIDTAAERAGTIDIGNGPAAGLDALCVDPTGKRLYAAVTDDNGSQVVAVDTETCRVHRVIPVGSPIRDIAVAGGTVYVLTSDRAVGGAVHVIELSTSRVTNTIELGGAPTQLVMSPDHARAYIVDYDRVAVLCTLSLEVVASLSVDARPSCVAFDDDGSHLYVADYSGVVSVFTVESTIEKLYSEFLATDPIALSVPRARELQPAAV